MISLCVGIYIIIIQLDERYRNLLIFCYLSIRPINICYKISYRCTVNSSNFLALAGSKGNFYILSCGTFVLDIVFLIGFLNFTFVVYQIYITI